MDRVIFRDVLSRVRWFKANIFKTCVSFTTIFTGEVISQFTKICNCRKALNFIPNERPLRLSKFWLVYEDCKKCFARHAYDLCPSSKHLDFLNLAESWQLAFSKIEYIYIMKILQIAKFFCLFLSSMELCFVYDSNYRNCLKKQNNTKMNRMCCFCLTANFESIQFICVYICKIL